MTDDISHKTCEQCGMELPASEIIIDEESGMQLCAVCSREQESCGCSDADE